MATLAKLGVRAEDGAIVDISHVSEVLEVADAILRRHPDQELIQKAFVLKGYLELSQIFPNRDQSEAIHKALADLTAAVHLHLNGELQAVVALFGEIAANVDTVEQVLTVQQARELERLSELK